MKFEAWPVEPPGLGSLPFSMRTMSGQPAMQRLMIRRPEYVRACATPVADDAVGRSLYISADIFLGNEEDMKDVAASVRKVESHYSHRAA